MRTYLLLLCVLIPAYGWAEPQTVDQVSDNPVIEARLKHLATELRCLVCQNETLADSRADLAVDLRNEIRGLIAKGNSDQQVIDYLVARYGDFVRFRPPLKSSTFLLWFGPFILAVLGVALLIVYLIRLRRRASNPLLTEAEQHNLQSLVNKLDGDSKS